MRLRGFHLLLDLTLKVSFEHCDEPEYDCAGRRKHDLGRAFFGPDLDIHDAQNTSHAIKPPST